ncbi:hypothetical protein GGR52DRAFT_463772 [Hypoxylon sp. FL1284]|nr:hypothetical protein GGR52DRAFT_463772 [Hypoxylon sp. FL1284]
MPGLSKAILTSTRTASSCAFQTVSGSTGPESRAWRDSRSSLVGSLPAHAESLAPNQAEIDREYWWAQDKNQVLLMVAEYDADYVDYISHRPATLSFAVMQEYGPFSVDSSSRMQDPGALSLALDIQHAEV